MRPCFGANARRADCPIGTIAFGPRSAMRLRPKWTVRLWLTSIGVTMVAWLAGLAWAAIWLIGLALS